MSVSSTRESSVYIPQLIARGPKRTTDASTQSKEVLKKAAQDTLIASTSRALLPKAPALASSSSSSSSLPLPLTALPLRAPKQILKIQAAAHQPTSLQIPEQLPLLNTRLSRQYLPEVLQIKMLSFMDNKTFFTVVGMLGLNKPTFQVAFINELRSRFLGMQQDAEQNNYHIQVRQIAANIVERRWTTGSFAGNTELNRIYQIRTRLNRFAESAAPIFKIVAYGMAPFAANVTVVGILATSLGYMGINIFGGEPGHYWARPGDSHSLTVGESSAILFGIPLAAAAASYGLYKVLDRFSGTRIKEQLTDTLASAILQVTNAQTEHTDINKANNLLTFVATTP